MKHVIAIDGHAASGKGTLARKLASRLGYAFMDTGALYRLVALWVIEAGKDDTDPAFALEAARQVRKLYQPADSDNPGIRTDAVSQMTSKISALPAVRAELLAMQRDFASNPPALADGAPAKGAILDGRDIGTVICPDAPVKFYVTASAEVRAQRRHKELQGRGTPSSYEAVLAEMRERDARDAGRSTAPLKPADDAFILDTSDMDADQVLDAALVHIGQKGLTD